LRTPETLEPIIRHALPIARQILEGVQAVEVIDRNLRHRVRLREPQVDRDTAASVLADVGAAPERDAAARGTEVELSALPRMNGVAGPETLMPSPSKSYAQSAP
jgi:hypothetical protein